jgi:pyridoxal phosphate enzyme (YggS family)
MSTIRDNVLHAQARVEEALERAGRSGDSVTIVGVTKTFGPDVVEALVDAGIEHIGENRVQEFLAKSDHVGRPCRWHLVGHLQRNKATKAIGRFHCIQSLDSVRLAQTLDRIGGERGVRTRVLLQVNTSGEDAKHGFSVEEVSDAAAEISELRHIELDGLMTIGPATMDPVETRECFRMLYRLRERIGHVLGRPLPDLSMGMSGDFETAIEEGATIVRLGRILTGERE